MITQNAPMSKIETQVNFDSSFNIFNENDYLSYVIVAQDANLKTSFTLVWSSRKDWKQSLAGKSVQHVIWSIQMILTDAPN